jgi:hypothetical protein
LRPNPLCPRLPPRRFIGAETANIETRELAENLFRESGIEFEGDFLGHVMATYELQQMKNGLGAGYQKQITQLEYHMKSVVDSFTSMLQMEQGDRIQLAEGYEEKVNTILSVTLPLLTPIIVVETFNSIPSIFILGDAKISTAGISKARNLEK